MKKTIRNQHIPITVFTAPLTTRIRSDVKPNPNKKPILCFNRKRYNGKEQISFVSASKKIVVAAFIFEHTHKNTIAFESLALCILLANIQTSPVIKPIAMLTINSTPLIILSNMIFAQPLALNKLTTFLAASMNV